MISFTFLKWKNRKKVIVLLILTDYSVSRFVYMLETLNEYCVIYVLTRVNGILGA